MSRQKSFYGPSALNQWTQEVADAFPPLSQPQAAGLATWSFGMVVAKSCALTAVASFLAKLLAQKFFAVRQRLREFYPEAPAKAGDHRRDLGVTTCFGPLLRRILRDRKGQRLAVAIDASTLGQLFAVLCISVAYRGCAIPVAWEIVPATAKGAWKDSWSRLLEHFQGLVPADWQVIVLADRGSYAKWPLDGIRESNWHPMSRINCGGKFRPRGRCHFVPLADPAPHVGSAWRGRGTAFATGEARLGCAPLTCWGEGHAEAWLILTDLPPGRSAASRYGLRSWIEQSFEDAKRGGWQWQQTRMTEAARAERLWLAVAAATVWLIRVGGAEEATAAEAMPELDLWTERERPRTKRWRLVSVFARGWVAILTALINEQRLPTGTRIPEPWPLDSQPPDPSQIRSKMSQVA